LVAAAAAAAAVPGPRRRCLRQLLSVLLLFSPLLGYNCCHAFAALVAALHQLPLLPPLLRDDIHEKAHHKL
jgi:hypothetical protein